MNNRNATTEDIKDGYDPDPYFRLLDLFFERNKQVLVKHHIDSFNQFIDEIIPNTVQSGENIISEKITENKVIRYRLTFDDLAIRQPTDNDEELLFPLDAIQKNLSYMAKYTATVTQYQDIIDIATGKKTTIVIGNPEKDVPIAKIPIMVGSKYCNLVLKPDNNSKHCKYDSGGYFIINGNEKVVLCIESIAHRKPMVFVKKDQNVLIYSVKVESRPVTNFVGNIQTFTIRYKKDNSLIMVIPLFKEISIFVLMRALGLETDEDIVNSILDVTKDKAILNLLLVAINQQGNSAMTRSDAIEILMDNIKSIRTYSDTEQEIRFQQKKKHVMKILTQIILPHITSGTNNENIDMLYKAHYIGYMIHKLLKHYVNDMSNSDEQKKGDDRDSVTNKRIELIGTLIGSLFDQFFKKMLNECNKIFKPKNVDDKRPPNIISHIKPNSIEQGLRKALATGDFGGPTRKGISQILNRLNHLHSLSYMRRIISPNIDPTTNKMTSPRHLHNTHYGALCPLETPEGPNVGIIKNLSMTECVTININSQVRIITDYIAKHIIPLESALPSSRHTSVKVFINGNWIGIANNIVVTHEHLRNLRFRGEIDKTVSLVLNYRDREYHISTDGGRLYRPFLTVTNNKLNFKPEMLDNVKSWDEFMIRYPNVIEFLDKEEEQNMMLALFPEYISKAASIMNKPPVKTQSELDKINRINRYDDSVYARFTHCEIHPSMILGIVSSNIPFPNHNQSPRGMFQYNQARQAMGIYISDYRERTDISYILYHTQIPLVTSRASKYTGNHIFPAGENVIVAIASYTGYNQEDSILMNSSAIEKGLFRAQTLKKSHKAIEKSPGSTQTGIFMKPEKDKVDNAKDINYDKLSEEGYAKVETRIQYGDVIIGMVNPKPITKEDTKPYRDNSVIYRELIPGTIDKVITGVNSDSYPIIKLRIRSERIPVVGDKFCCYDALTEILTSDGWIKFSDLEHTHMVASLINSSTLEYVYPSAIQTFDYSGQMYQIRTQHTDLLVTPNHNMLVSDGTGYKLVRADSIIGEKVGYVKAVSSVEGNDEINAFIIPESRNFKERLIDIDTWLKFFVAVLLEGIIVENKLIIKSLHDKISNKFITACYDMDIHVYFSHSGSYVIEDEQIISYFQQIDTDSSFPRWVWKLSFGQARSFIDYILNVHGYSIDDLDVKIETSKNMADNIQKLCIHAGICADYEIGYQSGLIALNITNMTNDIVNDVKKEDMMIEYIGKVYCCTVDSGVICVRRNGVVAFSGNSRAGQKGTIGFKPNRADMPYTESGLVPDIIINPNCMPKRMTIGQLLETLLGKLCVIKGVYGDATPFMGVDIDKINKELVDLGYDEWGNETMYNGMTGQKMATKIFIGPTYYQRLKQMVGDKAHSRARGQTNLLTRQPPEGRSSNKGLRLGEMERDALCAHGAAQFLKETSVDKSDIYTINVCDICGLFAHKVFKSNYYICRTCKNTTNISKIVIPYAFKLFMQELRAINILGRIRTSKSVATPKS